MPAAQVQAVPGYRAPGAYLRGKTAGGVIIPEKANMGLNWPAWWPWDQAGPPTTAASGCRWRSTSAIWSIAPSTAQPHQIKLDGKTYVIVRMGDMIGKAVT